MNETSDPSTPAPPRKPRPQIWLLAIGVVISLVLALFLGGLGWWLLNRPTISERTGRNRADANPAAPIALGTTELFNGRDLDGWHFDPTIWSVRNGVIYGQQKRGGFGSALFWQEADLADFEFHFRFRLVRGNSGIYYRANRLANFDVGGYEFEIYTNRTGNLADNGTDRPKRRLHRIEAAAPIDSDWHEGVIIAKGARLIHWLDGRVYCDVEDSDPAAPRTGGIALAMTSSTIVEFKDLRLKRLDRAP